MRAAFAGDRAAAVFLWGAIPTLLPRLQRAPAEARMGLQAHLAGVIPPFLTGCIRRTCATIFSFLCGGDAADAHVRAIVVASPSPLRGVILRLLDAFDAVLVKPSMPG